MSVVVTFTPTSGDLIWASYAGLRARPFIFILSVFFFIILPWFSIPILIAFCKPISNWAISAMLVMPVITVTAFALLPLRLYRNSPSLQGMHTYEFTTNEIHLFGPGFDNRVQWSIITRCLKFSKGFQFYSNKQPLITVPCRALSEKNWQALLVLLAEKGVFLNG